MEHTLKYFMKERAIIMKIHVVLDLYSAVCAAEKGIWTTRERKYPKLIGKTKINCFWVTFFPRRTLKHEYAHLTLQALQCTPHIDNYFMTDKAVL